MERNLNNEDFEEFLKFKTDHYKLYPSDNVWRGIYQSLHLRKRWLKIGGSLLFLSSLLFVTYQFNDRSVPHPEIRQHVTKNDIISEAHKGTPVFENILIAGSLVKATGNPPRKYTLPLIDLNNFNAPPNAYRLGETDAAMESVVSSPSTSNGPTGGNTITDALIPNASTVVEVARASKAEEHVSHDRSEINWLQEMAAMRLTSAKRHRFNLQFYFSPTISYRKLTDGNKSKGLSNAPLATNQLGVNNFVDHKPAIGVELGSNILFTPSKKLTLKTGLQLNYSRYTIKAYKFYFEKANIALVTSGRIADTMSSYTSLRNFNGYFPEELQNQYLQLSLPVGAELKLLGNKRLQLNVAGTIQPSYLLYNDTYLLSTDFINYTKEPTLVRKWNVNTSAEAFVSYYVGGMRWQVGPQFRYQTLSSYNDRYPIKEYLIEYGVKFGVSKTLR